MKIIHPMYSDKGAHAVVVNILNHVVIVLHKALILLLDSIVYGCYAL